MESANMGFSAPPNGMQGEKNDFKINNSAIFYS